MHVLVCINFLMHVRKLCSSGDGKVERALRFGQQGLVQCSRVLREPVGIQKGRGMKS